MGSRGPGQGAVPCEFVGRRCSAVDLGLWRRAREPVADLACGHVASCCFYRKSLCGSPGTHPLDKSRMLVAAGNGLVEGNDKRYG